MLCQCISSTLRSVLSHEKKQQETVKQSIRMLLVGFHFLQMTHSKFIYDTFFVLYPVGLFISVVSEMVN